MTSENSSGPSASPDPASDATKPLPSRSARFKDGILFIRIGDKESQYEVTPLNPDAEIGKPAFALMKTDGTRYDVIRRPFGWTCECGDFEFRRRNSEQSCKHIDALIATRVIKPAARQGENDGAA